MVWLKKIKYMSKWRQSGYSSPVPHSVKISILKNWGGKEFWIESGTYLGDTANELGKFAKEVHTVEPSLEFFKLASRNCQKNKNIYLYNGLSEILLPEILDKILSTKIMPNISFWLDGHFSQNNTYKGPKDTPILEELDHISKKLKQLGSVQIFIDDTRLFSKLKPATEEYPPLSSLVFWAEKNDLGWLIEQDIFIISNKYANK